MKIAEPRGPHECGLKFTTSSDETPAIPAALALETANLFAACLSDISTFAWQTVALHLGDAGNKF
jgi:hypothetical protein